MGAWEEFRGGWDKTKGARHTKDTKEETAGRVTQCGIQLKRWQGKRRRGGHGGKTWGNGINTRHLGNWKWGLMDFRGGAPWTDCANNMTAPDAS